MLFELNYRYHLYVFYEKNLNFCSNLKFIEELSSKLQALRIDDCLLTKILPSTKASEANL